MGNAHKGLSAGVQTSSMTLSRLDACMWENPESAGSLQQRLADELAMLPAPVLSSMVSNFCCCCWCS